MFEPIAAILAFFYSLVPNYAVAIALLTLLAMVITAPLTLKGTRGMMQMQMLQPEMKRLQLKYKDDRQKLNEELMAFYKENNLNPVGGCLPLIAQAPIFMALFWIVRGLSHLPEGATTFQPKYLDESTRLYESLSQVSEMRAFGFDLAESAQVALGIGFIHALPHVLMVAVVAITAYFQQKQIQGRNPNAEVPPQMKIMMRVFPAMFVVFAFISPGGLVVYFVVSNLCRIGLQAYITHTLYRGEDSMGARVAAASKEAKSLTERDVKGGNGKGGNGKGGDVKDGNGKGGTTGGTGTADRSSARPGAAKDVNAGKSASANGAKRAEGGSRPTSRTGAQNRSKKKKKRR